VVSRFAVLGPVRQLMVLVAVAMLLGGGIFLLSSHAADAGESCDGLDTALRNNLNFIAQQRADPDAQSAARIANRQAVVDLIQQRRRAAGCAADVTAAPPSPSPPATYGAVGKGVVCAGSTVTFFNEAAGPAASSGQFPIGTRLKVTNLDNNQAITVTVTSVSGSCVLLNNQAFDKIHEAGKNVIRKVRVERV
jgi:hypothetical protein